MDDTLFNIIYIMRSYRLAKQVNPCTEVNSHNDAYVQHPLRPQLSSARSPIDCSDKSTGASLRFPVIEQLPTL